MYPKRLPFSGFYPRVIRGHNRLFSRVWGYRSYRYSSIARVWSLWVQRRLHLGFRVYGFYVRLRLRVIGVCKTGLKTQC